MKNFISIATLLLMGALAAIGATNSGAQNDTTNTTLSAQMTLTSGQACLTSGTGVVLPSLATGVVGSIFLVEGEVMQASTNPSGTCYGVKRGLYGSQVVTHASSAFVWVGNPATSTGDSSRPFTGGAFITTIPQGSCIPANQYTLPVIRMGDPFGFAANGQAYHCFATSATATGVWGLMSGNVYGGTVASVAGAQWLAGTSLTISGTNAITGFTIPNGFASGQCITIMPTGAFTTTTAGNIAKASTAVANVTLLECWNGSKFVPSY